MVQAASYLIQEFFYRIMEFFVHWYGNSFFILGERAVNMLEILDRRLALKVTLRHFKEPLYQDYSVLGYVLGFVFRSVRIILSSMLYAGIVILFAGIYAAWVSIPPYIIWQIIVS